MKITQLMLGKGFGGAERYFVDLSQALAEAGHDVQVICHTRFKQIEPLRTHPSVHIQTIAPLGWWDPRAQRNIRSLLGGYQPDVVQAHLARGAYMAGKICRNLNLPLIVKTHNYVDLKYYRHVNCFVPTTDDQKAYLVKHGVDTNRIRVIPNFSSITPVENAGLEENGDPVIISYGRFVKKKGFDVLMRATKRLIESGRNIQIYIGGDGPELGKLLRLCAQLELGDRITFTGWIDNVRAFADMGNIFVLPSLDEPFGIAVLEMMALGKPIVATRTRGPMEILDESTAYLVEPGNEKSLADELNRAIDDNTGRRNKAEKALQVFRKKYAKEVVVAQLVNLYQELVKQGSG
jgi:glycosyltransferase involved in cell wall biosynthesis